MNANKQDAGGEVTNPDNVGGLPELPTILRATANALRCQSDVQNSPYRPHYVGAVSTNFDKVADVIEDAARALSAHPSFVCDFCGKDYSIAAYCCQKRREYMNAHGHFELCRAAPAGGDVTQGDWSDWFEAWAEQRGMNMVLTDGGRFLCPNTSLAQKAHEAGCMTSHIYYMELCRREELAKASAPAGSGEVYSTHHVHRGSESLPCYCAGSIDHPIGHEVSRDGERLAREFHETYERLAPSFGYETRQETRQFDPSTPNGRLMIAVCAALLRKLQQGAESFVSCTCHEERQKALCLNKHRCVRAYPLASQGQEGGHARD